MCVCCWQRPTANQEEIILRHRLRKVKIWNKIQKLSKHFTHKKKDTTASQYPEPRWEFSLFCVCFTKRLEKHLNSLSLQQTILCTLCSFRFLCHHKAAEKKKPCFTADSKPWESRRVTASKTPHPTHAPTHPTHTCDPSFRDEPTVVFLPHPPPSLSPSFTPHYKFSTTLCSLWTMKRRMREKEEGMNTEWERKWRKGRSEEGNKEKQQSYAWLLVCVCVWFKQKDTEMGAQRQEISTLRQTESQREKERQS